jgi:putative protease
MIKPELLMPAGNLEKLKYAIKYGADAVYLGVVDFSLRAMRKGELITLENLKLAVDTARNMGAKAYLTLNIFGKKFIQVSIIGKQKFGKTMKELPVVLISTQM